MVLSTKYPKDILCTCCQDIQQIINHLIFNRKGRNSNHDNQSTYAIKQLEGNLLSFPFTFMKKTKQKTKINYNRKCTVV